MKFSIGDRVEKTGGDYYFEGKVVAAFQKLSGAERYVVENPAGILHVYSEKNLKLWKSKINKIVDGIAYVDDICIGKVLTNKEIAKDILDNWMNPTLKEPRKPVINEDSDDCY